MTAKKLIDILKELPDNCKVMSNSGWECSPTDIEGVWYCETLNEVHFTQGGNFEDENGYDFTAGEWKNHKFKKIYCNVDFI